MDLHSEKLAGRTQQVYFSPEEAENYTYSFAPAEIDAGNTVFPQNFNEGRLGPSHNYPRLPLTV